MPAETAKSIRWVLTDIDDTMTRDGKLVGAAYDALCALSESGLSVIAVTGRSAGWGEIHLQEWPVDAVITENGAVSYWRKGDEFFELVHPTAKRNTERAFRVAEEAAFRAVPRARLARDNRFRLYDFAIDHAEYVEPPLTEGEVTTICDIFEREGCVAKPSSIHINCWMGAFDKRESSVMLLREMAGYDDGLDRDKVLYIGDALNDEPMFAHFPNASAVANVDKWLDRMVSKPSWISVSGYGEGFAEICKVLLSARL